MDPGRNVLLDFDKVPAEDDGGRYVQPAELRLSGMGDAAGVNEHAKIEARDEVVAIAILEAIGVVIKRVIIVSGLSGSRPGRLSRLRLATARRRFPRQWRWGSRRSWLSRKRR
jgi:hypothetical protein